MRVLDQLPRVAELSRNAARQAGSLARSAGRFATEHLRRRRGDDGDESGPSTTAATPAEAAPPAPLPAPAEAPTPAPAETSAPAEATAPAPAAPADAPPPAEPPAPAEHVDREAVVVAESADADAAGGAGAQVHVDEPWEGYGKLTAKQVIGELSDRSAATLAVARLYETANRNRRTVLAEIDRRLAAAEA